MSDEIESITGNRVIDIHLLAVFSLIFGVFVLYDNHHPTGRDAVVFAVSVLFWGFVFLAVGQRVGVVPA